MRQRLLELFGRRQVHIPLVVVLVVVMALANIPTSTVGVTIDTEGRLSMSVDVGIGVGPDPVYAQKLLRDRYGETTSGANSRYEIYKAPYYTLDSAGNWVSYIFTEEANYYQIQAARTSLRFYDYYTEVWAEDFSNALIYDDRWAVERKKTAGPNIFWRDVDFYNIIRSYQVVSDDEIQVIRTGDTDIGQRKEIYTFRVGQPCKLKIEQTSNTAETIRFVWKVSGIIASYETAEYDLESGKQQGLAYYTSEDEFVARLQWFDELSIASTIDITCEPQAQGRKATITFSEFSISAGGTAILDPKYEYYNTGDDTFDSVYSIKWVAQTFTPSTAHKITSVKLRLYRFGSPGTLTVSIRATDGSGHPTGDDLCSGTINANTITTDSAGAWYEITLGAGYNLDASTKYAIVARAPSGSSFHMVLWRLDTTSPTYGGGCGEFSTNSGSSWTSYAEYDFMFEDWGEALCSEDISNTPSSKDFGNVTENSTYNTTLTHFNVTNNSGGNISISIKGTDMAGGVNWTLSDTATPGPNTYGLKAGVEGGDFTIVVKLNSPYNDLVATLADGNSQRWGLKLYTPTSFSDGVAKSATITLTATCL